MLRRMAVQRSPVAVVVIVASRTPPTVCLTVLLLVFTFDLKGIPEFTKGHLIDPVGTVGPEGCVVTGVCISRIRGKTEPVLGALRHVDKSRIGRSEHGILTGLFRTLSIRSHRPYLHIIHCVGSSVHLLHSFTQLRSLESLPRQPLWTSRCPQTPPERNALRRPRARSRRCLSRRATTL